MSMQTVTSYPNVQISHPLWIESGFVVGFRLASTVPQQRLANALPFFLLLAYDDFGRPLQFPVTDQVNVKEFAICRTCRMIGNPERVPPYTPVMFNYQTDLDGKWNIWGRSPLNLSRIRNRRSAIAWLGVDSWIKSTDRRYVYDRLAQSMSWTSPVSLPKLVIRAAIALERDGLTNVDWTIAIEDSGRLK